MIAYEKQRCREPYDPAYLVRRYLEFRDTTDRFASFDYCYNYFQSFREREAIPTLAARANMQGSCLQIGFFLASWGMLRGSTDLLQRSVKHYEALIRAIAETPPEIWEIDANDYTDAGWATLQRFDDRVRAALPERTTDTLVSKIMLGVFGCVPAFDLYFRRGSGLTTFSRNALRRIELFYREHDEVIERFRVPTLDFTTGKNSLRRYPRAKVIDMIFYTMGGGD